MSWTRRKKDGKKWKGDRIQLARKTESEGGATKKRKLVGNSTKTTAGKEVNFIGKAQQRGTAGAGEMKNDEKWKRRKSNREFSAG